MTEPKKKKKKRANGEGTIYRDGNGWRGQRMIGGKRESASGSTFSEVKEELDTMERDYIISNANSKKVSPKKKKEAIESITVAEWAEVHLKKNVRPFITEGTDVNYSGFFRNHIIPEFGNELIVELDKERLEVGYSNMFYNQYNENGDLKYSHATVAAVSAQFKKCLFAAVDEGIITSNPHSGLRLHKLRPPQPPEAHTPEEQKVIVDFLTEENAEDNWMLYYFLLGTGVRIGEAIALNWNDWDYEKRKMDIHKISEEIHGNPHIRSRTKTEAGYRTITLPVKINEMLKRLKENQHPELNPLNLIFPSLRGTIRCTANVRRQWIILCGKMDIPYRTLHALRHTWATRQLEMGVNIKTVSVMLGHKDVVTTMNMYQHVLRGLQMEAADATDTVI